MRSSEEKERKPAFSSSDVLSEEHERNHESTSVITGTYGVSFLFHAILLLVFTSSVVIENVHTTKAKITWKPTEKEKSRTHIQDSKTRTSTGSPLNETEDRKEPRLSEKEFQPQKSEPEIGIRHLSNHPQGSVRKNKLGTPVNVQNPAGKTGQPSKKKLRLHHD